MIWDEVTWYNIKWYYKIWFNLIWFDLMISFYHDFYHCPHFFWRREFLFFSLFLTSCFWPASSSTLSKVKHPPNQRIRVRPPRLRSWLVKIILSWQLLAGKSVCKIVQGTCIRRIIASFPDCCLYPEILHFLFLRSHYLYLSYLLLQFFITCWYSNADILGLYQDLFFALLYSSNLMLAPVF